MNPNSEVIQHLRKRKRWPVEIDGATVYVRALLESEHREVRKFDSEPESYGFAIGCCLLNDDGTTALSRNPGEEAKTFGARVLAELDLPLDTRAQLCDRIVRLAQVPPVETIVKNSNGTTRHDSPQNSAVPSGV